MEPFSSPTGLPGGNGDVSEVTPPIPLCCSTTSKLQRTLTSQFYSAKKEEAAVEHSEDELSTFISSRSESSSEGEPLVTISFSQEENTENYPCFLQLLAGLRLSSYTKMPPISARSSFEPGAIGAQLEKAKANPSGMDSVPTWKLGFNAQIFARTCRILPPFIVNDMFPDWARFTACTDKKTFEQYGNGLKMMKERAWLELQAILGVGTYSRVEPVSPEFKQLAKDFYGGKEVIETYSSFEPSYDVSDSGAIASMDSDDSLFEISFFTQQFRMFAATILSDDKLVVLLLDACLSREINKAIENGGRYMSMRVSHSREHTAHTINLNRVEKAWTNRDMPIWTMGGTSYHLHPPEPLDATIEYRIVTGKAVMNASADDLERNEDVDAKKALMFETTAKSTKSKNKKKKKGMKPVMGSEDDAKVTEDHNAGDHEPAQNNPSLTVSDAAVTPTKLQGEGSRGTKLEAKSDSNKTEHDHSVAQPETAKDHSFDISKAEEASPTSCNGNPNGLSANQNEVGKLNPPDKVLDSRAKIPSISPKSANNIAKSPESVLPIDVANALGIALTKPESDPTPRASVSAADPIKDLQSAAPNGTIQPRSSTSAKQVNSHDQASSKARSGGPLASRKKAKAKAKDHVQIQTAQVASTFESMSQGSMGANDGIEVTVQAMYKPASSAPVTGPSNRGVTILEPSAMATESVKQSDIAVRSSIYVAEPVKPDIATSPIPIIGEAKQHIIISSASNSVNREANQPVAGLTAHVPAIEVAQQTVAVTTMSTSLNVEVPVKDQDKAVFTAPKMNEKSSHRASNSPRSNSAQPISVSAIGTNETQVSEESLSHKRFPSLQGGKSQFTENGKVTLEAETSTQMPFIPKYVREADTLNSPAQMIFIRNPRVLAIQFGDIPIGFGLSLPPGISQGPQIIHPKAPSANDEVTTSAVSHTSPSVQVSEGRGEYSADISPDFYNPPPSFATPMPSTYSDQSVAFSYNNNYRFQAPVQFIPQENPIFQGRASRSYSVPSTFNNDLIDILKLIFATHSHENIKEDEGEADYVGHAHAHPAASDSQASEQNDQRPAGSSAFFCLCCKVVRFPTADEPVYFCPFCGPLTNVRYCSRACILADAFEHTHHCVNYPASDSAVATNLPSHYVFDKDAIASVQHWDSSGNHALFRQKIFSMYCFTGPFPEICKAWSMKSPARAGIYPADLQEALTKVTGDYHIFRSEVTAVSNFSPTEVIATFKIPPRDPLKYDFNRLLLACFMFGMVDRQLVTFLFRLINHLILVDHYFNRYMVTAVPRETIWSEFRHQFEQEFGVRFSEGPLLNLGAEWPLIAELISRYEAGYQDLVIHLMRKLALAT